MQNLDIELFSPKQQELQELVKGYSNLVIAGPDDKEGYRAVDEARKDLKKVRVGLTKTGKDLRADAVAFQKKVLAKEKELIAIVAPVELVLEERLKEIDEIKMKEARLASLPDRIDQLRRVEVTMTDDELLSMNDAAFACLLVEKKQAFLDRKEAAMKEEKERLEAELEAAKLATQKAENDRIAAAEAAAKEKADAEARFERDRLAAITKAEDEKNAALAIERQKADKEKQDLIDKQRRKEAAEQEAKEAALKAEAEAKKTAEAMAAYTQSLRVIVEEMLEVVDGYSNLDGVDNMERLISSLIAILAAHDKAQQL